MKAKSHDAMRTSEQTFWKSASRMIFRLVIFVFIVLAPVFLFGEISFKRLNAQKIESADKTFSAFRGHCNSGDFEQAKNLLKDRDHVKVIALKKLWRALESHASVRREWIIEETNLSLDPQVIGIHYRLIESGPVPKKVRVRFVPADSSWAIQEIHADTLDLKFSR